MKEKKLIEILTRKTISYNSAKREWCGERLGWGAHREVYVLRYDPNYVVKMRNDPEDFSNVKEWLIWSEIRYADAIAKWFAPCIVINNIGTVLVQKRVDFDRPKKDYPKRIPKFFTDLKYQNYGFIGDQLVCVDYGSVLLSSLIDIKRGEIQQMRTARWWDEVKVKRKDLKKRQ